MNRDDFMVLVCNELESDPDNCRANRIIDAADEYAESAFNPTADGTLIIPVSKEDFEKVKRIILDCKPYCRTFYEDAPGEAHWIKRYTPDDGEIYECDNCGVTWQFNDGGPEENEAFFCPKCGFKMAPEGEIDGQTD